MIHYLRFGREISGIVGDPSSGGELDAEIKMHLRLLTERYVRQVMTEAEAASTVSSEM
jgi:hypothetical protein